MTKVCSSCGESFKRIGSHWSSGRCTYPDLTDKQKEIATGILMGDGHIDATSTPCLVVNMITKKYLKYVDNCFGVLGNGVKLHKEPEGNRKTVYRWTTVRHPYFKELESWYNSGNKVFPSNIEITPRVLRHWYCGDGSWKGKGSGSNLEIAMANEMYETNKISELFKEAGLPTPNYKSYENEDNRMCTAYFSSADSPEVFDFMGDSLVGFEYKWPGGE